MKNNRRTFLGQTITAAGLFFAAPRGAESVEHKSSDHHHHHHDGGHDQQAAAASPAPAESAGALTAGMSAATLAVIKSLDPALHPKIKLPMPSEARYDWHFVPKVRKGVPFKEMSAEQRRLVHALLRQGLGARGYDKVTTIISLEDVLKEIEKGTGPVRDPENYYLTVFGEPGARSPWALSFEGHHISLNYTFAKDRVATAPLFLGSNPGEVKDGPRRGTAPLAPEEALGRELFKSLEGALKTAAVISDSAPKDILTGNARRANPLQPAGIAAGKLTGKQSEILMRLLREYAETMPEVVAARRMRDLRAAGFNNIFFGWAGSEERFQPHYYRIQGPGFLVEYDNTQNNANHIHTVWRDLQNDFGDDLLARHHRESHRHHHRHA